MKVRADVLYKVLKAYGPLEKTYIVEEITKCTDEVTGKTKERSKKTKHAVIQVMDGTRTTTVDFYLFRDDLKTLKKQEINVEIRQGDFVEIAHANGELVLFRMDAKPSVELDLRCISDTAG